MDGNDEEVEKEEVEVKDGQPSPGGGDRRQTLEGSRGRSGGPEVRMGSPQPHHPLDSEQTAALPGPHRRSTRPPPLAPPPHGLRTPPQPDGGRASPAAAKGP
jgi:hypothetical protein